MFHLRSWMILLVAAGNIGCSHDLQGLWPGHKDEPESAKVTAATPAPAPTSEDAKHPEPAPSADALKMTPENTTVSFTGSSLIVKQPGTFDRFDGRLELPTENLRDARLTFSVDTDSVTTNISLLTNHLKRPDFLDVEHYPKASFVSSKILQVPGGGVNHTITGELTIHGVTKTLEIPARISVTPKFVSLDATIELHQSEFGMEKAAKKADDLVPVVVSSRITRPRR